VQNVNVISFNILIHQNYLCYFVEFIAFLIELSKNCFLFSSINWGTTNCSDLNRGILTVGLVRLG